MSLAEKTELMAEKEPEKKPEAPAKRARAEKPASVQEVLAESSESNFGDAVIDASRPLVEKGRLTMQTLLAEEKLSVFVPLAPNDTQETHDFYINGLRFTVPKGKIVRVPKSLAELVLNSVGSK